MEAGDGRGRAGLGVPKRRQLWDLRGKLDWNLKLLRAEAVKPSLTCRVRLQASPIVVVSAPFQLLCCLSLFLPIRLFAVWVPTLCFGFSAVDRHHQRWASTALTSLLSRPVAGHEFLDAPKAGGQVG